DDLALLDFAGRDGPLDGTDDDVADAGNLALKLSATARPAEHLDAHRPLGASVVGDVDFGLLLNHDCWSVVSCPWSVVGSGRRSFSTTDNGPLTTDLLPLFRRLAGHHFFGRHLDGALRGALDDADQAVVLGLAERPTLGDLDGVALLSVVLLVVGMQDGA